MAWDPKAPQGSESLKVLWELVPYTSGRGLDLGCGPSKAFPHFIGVDNNADERLFGISATGADVIVPTCESLDMFASDSMDFVFSSHLLEHIKDYQSALREWYRVIKPGGYLVLYLPHKDFYPNIGQDGANPDHKHDFLPSDIVVAMSEVGGWELVRNEDRNEGNEYSFFQVYQKRDDGAHIVRKEQPRPRKKAGVVRYGGIGDMIQAASIFPGLKRQGFHVTVYTTELGRDILAHDPNVDEFYVQGKDQVPNAALTAFWAHESKKFDRWINLSESVEGTWLALPGRVSHGWPHEARAKHLNKNYAEFIHDLAEVPHKFEGWFHPTADEKRWAEQERAKAKGRLIMWSLSGSSVHKAWPWTDQVIARLMTSYPDVHVLTVGDALSAMLESGWQNEPRVLCRSGKLTIRQTLALAPLCDLVIGPETGVLNAVGMLPVPKIIMMSHSSRENLTKHWQNTIALTPKNTPCYPCHRMHYGWKHCVRNDDTGAAQCQHDITVDQVWQVLCRNLAVAA